MHIFAQKANKKRTSWCLRALALSHAVSAKQTHRQRWPKAALGGCGFVRSKSMRASNLVCINNLKFKKSRKMSLAVHEFSKITNLVAPRPGHAAPRPTPVPRPPTRGQKAAWGGASFVQNRCVLLTHCSQITWKRRSPPETIRAVHEFSKPLATGASGARTRA